MAAERRPVLLLTADTVGGVWTYAVDQARCLVRRGIDVHLATMGAPLRSHQRLQISGCRGLTLHESEWRLEWMADPWDDLALAGAWLQGLEQEIQPDLVHLNQFAFGALPFRAPKLVVAHSCVLSWWRAVHGQAAPATWAAYRTRVAEGLAGADMVAAPSAAMLRSLSRNYGRQRTGRVLPNGRNTTLFRPGGKLHYVFAAGRFWDEAKNIGALDAVAAGLPWPVKIAGSCAHPDGREVRPVHAEALGELPAHDIARRMAAASIYALPARYEPFGLSILEAGLSGCALVLGDIPSLREVWGDAALYVPPDDHEALRRTLARLVDDQPERTRLALAARQRGLQFSAERMADAYLQAYATLAGAFRAAPTESLLCA
ncbi:MAG: glycosyltransferase family 4 protein [Ramlibacter sp.]